MHTYIASSLINGTETSEEDFFDWFSKASRSNPNLVFCFNFVFRLLHPLFLFRAGVRQTNDKVALAGRELTAAIFYGFNNPRYRLLNAHDTLYLLSVPRDVEAVVCRQAYRKEGGGHVGQGGDFLQEEENRNVTDLLSDGMPTAEQWSEASCAVQHIKEVFYKFIFYCSK